MTTFVTLTSHATVENIEKIKTPQCRQLMSYLLETYGTNNPVDQGVLLLDLNAQQNTGKALKNGSAGPISRIYEFYRKKGMVDTGFITVTKSEPKATSASALQAEVDRLRVQLKKAMDLLGINDESELDM